MGEEYPGIKARSSQETLSYLDVFRAGLRSEVEAKMAPEVLDAILRQPSTGWVPIELDAQLGRAVLGTLGREEALRFWIRYVTHQLDSPLLAGPVRAALSILGATPGSLVKWMPKVLPLVYRGLFDLHVDSLESNRAELRYDVKSDVFLDEPAFAVVLEATIRALFVFTRTEGTARVRRDRASRSYVVDATWK